MVVNRVGAAQGIVRVFVDRADGRRSQAVRARGEAAVAVGENLSRVAPHEGPLFLQGRIGLNIPDFFKEGKEIRGVVSVTDFLALGVELLGNAAAGNTGGCSQFLNLRLIKTA